MTHYTELLEAIDPGALAYDEWLSVGMAIQHEGGTVQEWDRWSQQDTARYHAGDCEKKWAGFRGTGTPVTGGTLYTLAVRQGWLPQQHVDRAYDWDEVIEHPNEGEPLRVIDPNWVEEVDVNPPGDEWDGVAETIKYLETLYESNEYVGYVMESWKKEGTDKFLPKKGYYHETAGKLIADLSRYGNIGEALGDYDPEAGAWIRFNPLDGEGVKDSNVTAHRYALVESDNMDIEQQAGIYEAMELPIAALVHSGGRSLHAIVRIDADSSEEYRERVNFLHDTCKQNGLTIDTANRNPSRLSRLPGAYRNGQKQFLVAVNQGKRSWTEWKEWVEELNDDLPDIEPLIDVYYNLPDLAPELIEGVLRVGHKMLLAGPSKAGKSFLLMQMLVAIAEGMRWLGWQCRQGRVLYVNLELDRASCFHRIKLLYEAMGIPPTNISNIDVWNLRGSAVPMDKLTPKLIRRSIKKEYTAIIIDPIYKVITGDENAADKMAHFCNQFDKVCTQLGCAAIYCHHHSKGAQGQKEARDRSSGSGVFARDPDALLDLIELKVPKAMREVVVNSAICDRLGEMLDEEDPNWRAIVPQDDTVEATKLAAEARKMLLGPDANVDQEIAAIQTRVGRQTAWRMEGTLREFAPFEQKNFWFAHPLHVMDDDGVLEDAKADGEMPPWQKTPEQKEEAKEQRKKAEDERKAARLLERSEALDMAFTKLEGTGAITLKALAEKLDIDARTVRNHINEHPGFRVENGVVERKEMA